MVKALVEYYGLGMSMILIKNYSKDEFSYDKTLKVSMAAWNPLLIAIAFKRLDIVRYML